MVSKSIVPPTNTTASKVPDAGPDSSAIKTTAETSEKIESKVPEAVPDKMAINYILNSADTDPIPPKLPLIQKMLHRDILFMIFDAIVDSNNNIILSTTTKNPSHAHLSSKHHPILGPLSQTSHQFRAEIIEWSKTRQDLTRSTTFGLFNPLSTSFDFVWIAPNKLESHFFSSKIQRIYHPVAAIKHLQRLELWQRGLWTIARFQDPRKRYAHAIAIGLATACDFEWHGLHPDFRKANGGRRSVRPEMNEHLGDGVRDVLVLDWEKYGEKMFPKQFIIEEYGLQLGWEDGKQAFVWSDGWERFEENRKIVDDDEVSAIDLASVC